MTNTDVYDIDAQDRPKPKGKQDPLYRIYDGSRLAIGKGVGKAWQQRYESAKVAYQSTTETWDEVLRYYNNNQNKSINTPRGLFKRGDSTENVIYSNVNIMLPAIYSKNPDITCSTIDKSDEPFCKTLQAVLNVSFKKKQLLNAKPYVKRAAGFALLTNFGIIKLDWTMKNDSREKALEQLQELSDQMKKAKTPTEVENIYGKMQALEANMEVYKPSGPGLSTVLPFNLTIDPHAEQADGLDADWMIEECYINTAFLNARYVKKSDTDEEDGNTGVLIYKPSHKAVFTQGQGRRDDGLGLVLAALSGDEKVGNTEEERMAFIQTYYTKCAYVWDKTSRRVFLYSYDDWTWPIWVWDDPLKITRFFPYFIISFGFSTGSTVSVGETAYVLDQQDDVNDINRQLARIRRTIFDFFFYNSEQIDPDQAEKFIKAIRGELKRGKHALGIKAGEGSDLSKFFKAIEPPSLQYEVLFNKQPSMEAINRITNTNDALRGTQFKTNTNEASVNSYQESLRISVGAKVDIIEDLVSDIAESVSELAVQNWDMQDIINLVGDTLAQGWEQMTVPQFQAQYTVEIVAGSMEKPNSVFKKKEAVQVVQAVGQFAQAAPGATLQIMLRVLQSAFTEVNIKDEDWDLLSQEISANMQKGVTTGGGGQGQQGGGGDLAAQAKNLPEDVKQAVVQMKQQGKSDQEILAFIQQKIKEQGNGSPQEPAQQ